MSNHPNTPVNSRYGAPMGRHGDNLSALIVEPQDSPFTLQRVRLVDGCYDRGGAYWGSGQPLYWWAIEQEGCEASGYFRANNRAAAKALIRELHPAARFYS